MPALYPGTGPDQSMAIGELGKVSLSFRQQVLRTHYGGQGVVLCHGPERQSWIISKALIQLKGSREMLNDDIR